MGGGGPTTINIVPAFPANPALKNDFTHNNQKHHHFTFTVLIEVAFRIIFSFGVYLVDLLLLD